jgi:glycosyltransferase involved in cell wall biosynthesis
MEEMKEEREKKTVILSVSRFDPGGNKQQIEMIRAFKRLVKQYPDSVRGWKLVLAGGSVRDNPYLGKIHRYLAKYPFLNVEVRINVPEDELRAIYRCAKIFWHLCGLNQKDPAKVEHFGMNIVEAMQNSCVPIVFKGGGQTEIVEEGISGYLFANEEDLLRKTVELLDKPDKLLQLSKNAYERGKRFHVDIFIDKVQAHFKQLLNNYKLVADETHFK